MTEERNADVAAGEVISQSPEEYSYANPDESITITVSTGDQEPAAAQPESSAQNTTGQLTQQNAAAAAGEVWKCTQAVNTPSGYQGGLIRLELVQEVSGEMVATTVADGQTLTFPYTLTLQELPVSVREPYIYQSRSMGAIRNWDIIRLLLQRQSNSCRERS